jgi:hypothetical protein
MTGRTNYGYAGAAPRRRGPSALLIGGVLLLLVVALTAGGMYALGIGPFSPATPTASLAPGIQPSPTPSSAPSTSAAPTVTASPSPSGSPNPSQTSSLVPSATPSSSESPRTTDQPNETPVTPSFTIPPTTLPGTDPAAVLLGHVPPAFSASCSPTSASQPVVAQVSCSVDEGALLVEYFLYATRDEMGAAYQAFVETAQIEPGTGDCAFYGSWPTENGYRVGGLTVGRYLCIDSGTEPALVPSIYWTDDRFNILAQASHSAANRDRLLDFWTNEAGPIP